MQRELHPSDAYALRKLGEVLCDLSAGRATINLREFADGVTLLMANIRSDHSARGLADVVDRLVGLADWRSGAEAMADAAFVEIMLSDAEFVRCSR